MKTVLDVDFPNNLCGLEFNFDEETGLYKLSEDFDKRVCDSVTIYVVNKDGTLSKRTLADSNGTLDTYFTEKEYKAFQETVLNSFDMICSEKDIKLFMGCDDETQEVEVLKLHASDRALQEAKCLEVDPYQMLLKEVYEAYEIYEQDDDLKNLNIGIVE